MELIPGEIKEFVSALAKLTALERRTEDAMGLAKDINKGVTSLIERLAALEKQVQMMERNVKNEILAQMNYTLGQMQVRYEAGGEGVGSVGNGKKKRK